MKMWDFSIFNSIDFNRTSLSILLARLFLFIHFMVFLLLFFFLFFLFFLSLSATFFIPIINLFLLLFFLFHMLLLHFLFLFFPLVLAWLLFLPRFNLIIDRNFLEVVVSEKQREIAITVTLRAKDYFVLFFGKGWVLCVYVFHYGWNLFGIDCPCVLKPNNLTVDPTVIAVWSYGLCGLLQGSKVLWFCTPNLAFDWFAGIERGSQSQNIIVSILS